MSLYFPEVKKPIPYAGPRKQKALAFRFYDPERKVAGRTMAWHLRFAVAYWHAFKGLGDDPFGWPTFTRPWMRGMTRMEIAERTLEAAFEFFSKLGVGFYCFHDRDLAPEGDTPAESAKNLDRIVKKAKKLQRATGVKPLWGTANLFGHPRYAHGAATNPDPLVFAHAATQVRRAIDATQALGGKGYVFWGGREGYSTLLNTRMHQEREQLAAFLHMAVCLGARVTNCLRSKCVASLTTSQRSISPTNRETQSSIRAIWRRRSSAGSSGNHPASA